MPRKQTPPPGVKSVHKKTKINPRGSGRQPYEPTASERLMVKLLIAAGVPRDSVRAALAAGTKNKMVSQPTFCRVFKHELIEAKSQLLGMVLSKGLMNALQGDQRAIEFMTTCVLGLDKIAEQNRDLVVDFMEAQRPDGSKGE